MDPIRLGWKVLTHDYRPPLQGGEPVWDGVTLPHRLRRVKLDASESDCAAGWNYCSSLAVALKIAGLWPNGRPSVAFAVEAGANAIERENKRRASTLTLLRRATDDEVASAIAEMSTRRFGEHAEEMVREQLMWRVALERPGFDAAEVESGLRAALVARGLGAWTLKRFDSARDAWDARDAWAARDAWDARDAWAARAAWAAWAAWDARAAWAAWDALVVRYSARRGWISADAELQTTGIRSAYSAGLGACLPTDQSELGWSMVDRKGAE